MLRVVKFGGSTVRDFPHVVLENLRNPNNVIVLSAVKGMTDLLISGQLDKCASLFKTWFRNTWHCSVPARIQLYIDAMLHSKKKSTYSISFGEKLTCMAFAEMAQATCRFADSGMIVADGLPTCSKISYIDVEDLRSSVKLAQSQIITGFIARHPSGQTCLLGRDGSDTTAAAIASKLQ